MVRPYPKDQLCPKCKKFNPNLYDYVDDPENQIFPRSAKEFEKRTTMASSKFKGKVRVKERDDKFSLEDETTFRIK